MIRDITDRYLTAWAGPMALQSLIGVARLSKGLWHACRLPTAPADISP